MAEQDPYQYTEKTPPIEDEFIQLLPETQKKGKNEDSLDNNIDALSDKNDQINDLGNINNILQEDFQNTHMNALSDNNLRDLNVFESKRQQSIFSEAEVAIIERGTRFQVVLEEMINNFQNIPADKMLKLVSLIMAIKSNLAAQADSFARAIIFLRQLWNRIKNIPNMTPYNHLLNQILKSSQPLYSISMSDQDVQFLFFSCTQQPQIIYNENEDNIFSKLGPPTFRFSLNQDLISMQNYLNQYLSNQIQPEKLSESTYTPFYNHVYANFFDAAFRPSIDHLLTNTTILSKAPNLQIRHEYMQRYKESLFIPDFSQFDKRSIEDYTSCFIEIATDKLQHAQMYLFRLLYWLLGENSQMERRISGFKVVGDLVALARAKTSFASYLADWLHNQQILEIFLRQSTHSRILQQLSPILHFLYQHGKLQSSYLVEIMKYSLHSQDLFRIVQGMLSWLRIQHLQQAYDMLLITKDHEKESMLSQFLNALVSSPTLLGNNRKRKNIMIQDNRRDLEGQMQIEMDQLSEKAENLVKRLMKLLVEKTMVDQQLFMPILLRHITSHMKFIKPILKEQIIALLRNNSPTAVWILEQYLKVETSHNEGQGKCELIGHMCSQGAYEYTLALIARHRYNKIVVDKCLNVVILFCRYHKALERPATQFLWKVLGLTATDERQRQQFFVFLKDIVRFENAVSQQSVNFIFFQLLLALSADWFSLRVYDCFQMLFLRLNEDCKLINFQKDHYDVIKPPLIGTQKLWHIYFNCPDLKVIKKCKDFIFKLISNSKDKKQLLYEDSLNNIKRYLEAALQLSNQSQNKQQILILRGFEISEKLFLEKQRMEDTNKYNIITLKIVDSTPGTFEKHKNFEINEKLTLSDLKLYIADNLNPPRKSIEIELINKGKVLVGENQTLKQMKLQNNETIAVTLIDTQTRQLSKSQKQQIKKEQQQKLFDLFGDSFADDFVKYIVEKFQGQTLQNIANIMFDQGRISQIRDEYQRSKEQGDEMVCIENIEKKEEPKKFGEMLIETMNNVQLLLRCLMVSHNKKGIWKFLKQLPINKEYLKMVEAHIQTGDWIALFRNRTQQQCKYIAYILIHIIKQYPVQSDVIFNEKQLRDFLIQWILNVVETSMENIQDHENIFKLLLTSLSCPLFEQVQIFVTGKKNPEEESILSKKLESIMDIQMKIPVNISNQICSKLINALTVSNLSERMATTVVKLYVYQLYYFQHQQSSYSILSNPQLYQLLLRYGKPIYFTIIASALRLQKNRGIIRDFNISKFALSLLHTFMNNVQRTQQSFYYSAFFSCLQQLMRMTSVQNLVQQLNALLAVLRHLKDRIKSILQQEIIGYMKISLTILYRHLIKQHGERRNDEIRDFAHWLFNQYLFGIPDSLPFFKSKSVRKISYQLILGLCSYHLINKDIVNSIKRLIGSCKGLEKQEGEFRTTQFIGMKNMGATCYINSLTQQFYHTIFPKLLLKVDNSESTGQIKLLQLKKLFVNLYIGANSPVITNKYVQTVKINGQPILPHVQQDVHQYFLSLLHEIQQQVGNQAINSILSGTYCNEIRGLQQGSEMKNVGENFFTHMVEIKGKKNLNQALSHSQKPHIYEGDNMYYSEVLNKKIRASSKTYLDKLPPLLVVTLKRFHWQYETMTRHKINDYFQFPLELELSKFSVPGKKQPDHYYQYKLCGIIIHSGSAQSGHYYSYIKVGEKWLQFNDRRVTQWDIQNNLKSQCFGGNEERNRNAYMLFYQKVDSHVHGASLHELPSNNILIKLVKNENQTFIKNKLIYDSGFIDFIKELSKMQRNKSLLDVLDTLNITKSSYEPMSAEIDVDNLISIAKNDNYVQDAKDKSELSKKLNDINNIMRNYEENAINLQDNNLNLLMPDEKGTQNDKL